MAFEAIRAGRVAEARQHLGDAHAASAGMPSHLEHNRRKLLERYYAMLARKSNDHLGAKADNNHHVVAAVPEISFVTTVFNRLWQLQLTLRGNLETIRAESDVDLVLVDFGGEDSADIGAMLEAEFVADLLSGKLKYYVANVPWTRFHMATAKNVAHRLSTGRFIFSLDADNHLLHDDLSLIRGHVAARPEDLLHQTTGPAPMAYRMWAKYELFEDESRLHDINPTWDGSCGRIGISRKAFERVNGYNENFVGMGMDDIDFMVRIMKTGSRYCHERIQRAADQVFVDNGTADASHEHDGNRKNWQVMDESVSARRYVPVYKTDSPPSRFSRYVARMVRMSAQARVTLFSSLFRIEPYLERFLNDLRGILGTQGVCIWLLDVRGSHPQEVSDALKAAADGERVFYVPVRHDPGLYALWNVAITQIKSPFIGNLNADDLRGSGWLRACLEPLEAGLAEVASPVTVPFGDGQAVDHGEALQQLRAGGKLEQRWFDCRCTVRGTFPQESIHHEPLQDGIYSQEDFFQILADGNLASYCIPNASAVWKRSLHDVVGMFDEGRYGAFADLALWCEAGGRGMRFRQVDYPALFFVSESQAHRRQARHEERLVQLATRFSAPSLRSWLGRRQFDLSRAGGTFGDHHFKGWNWVRDEVLDHFQHTKQRILLDMFVERTFFWNPNPEERNFRFERPWAAFVHTTPHNNAAYDLKGQNLNALLAEPAFLESLPLCKGLIALSRQNQSYLRQRLLDIGFDIPVYRLFHPNIPMDTPRLPCSIDLGTAAEPLVFHVGWHLRSFSAFANLDVDRSRKVLLIPKNIPKDHFVQEVVNKELRLNGMGPMETYFGNAFTASQDDYAHILRNALVFNHYVEPAGSNLISECISAGTRLLINRHPAFEEYLGADYPLFYESGSEADLKARQAITRGTAAQVTTHLEDVRNRWSIGAFCRELERIGQDIYRRL
jgi:hypothetical protein